jgi:hypothetical protein
LLDISSFGTLELFPVSTVSISGLKDFSDLIDPFVHSTVNGFEAVSHAPKGILTPLTFVIGSKKTVFVTTITVVKKFVPAHLANCIPTEKVLCRLLPLIVNGGDRVTPLSRVGLTDE